MQSVLVALLLCFLSSMAMGKASLDRLLLALSVVQVGCLIFGATHPGSVEQHGWWWLVVWFLLPLLTVYRTQLRGDPKAPTAFPATAWANPTPSQKRDFPEFS